MAWISRRGRDGINRLCRIERFIVGAIGDGYKPSKGAKIIRQVFVHQACPRFRRHFRRNTEPLREVWSDLAGPAPSEIFRHSHMKGRLPTKSLPKAQFDWVALD